MVFLLFFNLSVVLELVPVARDLIHIRGVHTGFYLAVNKCGEVYTTVSHGRFSALVVTWILSHQH